MRNLFRARAAARAGTVAASSADAAASSSAAASTAPSRQPVLETAGLREQFDAEFAAYMRSESVPDDSDPLQWWRSTGQQFKMLLPLARKYMTPLATSAIVEGCFSRAKRWCKDQRSCIGDYRFDVMTTLDSMLSDKTEDELDGLLRVGSTLVYNSRACAGSVDDPDISIVEVDNGEEPKQKETPPDADTDEPTAPAVASDGEDEVDDDDK